MMPNSLCIDSDRHVIEPFALWQERLPRHLRARAPREVEGVIRFEGGDLFANVSPRARALVSQQATARRADLQAASHAAGQLSAMDRQDVDIAYLYPTYALYVAYVDGTDPELSSALVHAYNEWLLEYCSADPQRLRGVGTFERTAGTP
jgi:predicted TIM-barrel fold metal-dependent hydrolase